MSGQLAVWFWRVLRFLKLLVTAVAVLLACWLLWSLIAYRDLSVAELSQDYGPAGNEALRYIPMAVDGGKPVARAQRQPPRMAYRVNGELGQPAVLLIHNHYFNSRMFQPWVDGLGDDYYLLRPDLSSHGLTGPEPNNDYSMTRDVRLIKQLLDREGLQRVVLVGSSLGGNIAFHFAARYPDRVAGLVLVNSGGLPKAQSSKRNAAAIPSWFHHVFYLLPSAVYKQFLAWMMVDERALTDDFVQEFHRMFRRQGNRKAEMARMRQFDVGEPLPVLASIRAPVLLQWGEDNPQLPLVQMAKLAEAMTGAESIEQKAYAGAGHVLPLEKPEQSLSDLQAFLARLEKSKGGWR